MYSWVHLLISLTAVDPEPFKKIEDDTHDRIIKLILQESVNVDEMVKDMETLETKTNEDDSAKSMDDEGPAKSTLNPIYIPPNSPVEENLIQKNVNETATAAPVKPSRNLVSTKGTILSG